MGRRRPPILAERILELVLEPGVRDEILGDLEETFHARRPGVRRSLWYWMQTVGVVAVITVQRLLAAGRIRSDPGVDGSSGAVARFTHRRGMMKMRGWGGEMMMELRITVRGLLHRPGYTLLALATIVLGVASVTAAYGLLHQVVLRSLPFEEADRLVAIRTLYDSDVVGLTPPEYLEVAEHADALESVAALVEPNLDADWTWAAGGGRQSLAAVRVTDGFFRTLGVTAELGTLVGEGVTSERRVVVSREFWLRELGAASSVVGSVLRINAEPYVVTGVLPATFEFPLGRDPMDVWILFTPEPMEAYVDMPLAFRGIGRLAPGVGQARAAAEVSRLVDDFRAALSDTPGRVVIRSLEEDLVGSARRPLLLLTLAGCLVLVVASLNLSMLIAARNLERREELNVRTALGATRGRLFRQLVSEAGVLAIIGGSIAVGVAALVLGSVFDSRPGDLGRLAGAGIGPEVILVGLAAAVVPAILAAALPALRTTSGVRGLGSRGASTDRGRQRVTWSLAAVESGVVFTLLVVAALVLRSLDEVTSVDPGFDTSSALVMTLALPPDQNRPWDLERTSTFLIALEERLEAQPGVHAAGTITNLPLAPESWAGSLVIEGRDDLGTDGTVVVDWELASPGYFDAIGIPIVRGRGFDERDRADAGPVVLINETLARRWWPEGDAIGTRISGGGGLRTVVGIVGDVKQQGLHTGTRGFMYLPMLQTGAPAKQELVVRVEGDDPAAAVGHVRTALMELEPDLAIGSIQTLEVLVSASAGSFRLRAVLLGAFATMALGLGMAGIYGVTAHRVRTRRRDLGIRMAMGADGGRIMTGVLGEALVPVVWGLAGGLVMVFLAAPALRGFLFGVGPTDVELLAGIAALLLASGAAAVAPSAVRARRIDPAGMLRNE